MKVRSHNIKKLFLIFFVFFLVFSLIGCEAFVRKFKRKPKKEALSQEEMVLQPIEYPISQIDKEELYRRYFLYVRSWQDELIESFNGHINRKKQSECIVQSIRNLNELKQLLKKEKQDTAELFISKLRDLQSALDKDVFNFNTAKIKSQVERLKKDIVLELSPDKIKEALL